MAHGPLTPIIGLRLLALAAGLPHNAEIGQPGLCFSAYGHKFGINHPDVRVTARRSQMRQKGWNPYGAPWLQLAAGGGKCSAAGDGEIKPKPLPRVATGCLRSSMVRRGSTVRVRQRASAFRLL